VDGELSVHDKRFGSTNVADSTMDRLTVVDNTVAAIRIVDNTVTGIRIVDDIVSKSFTCLRNQTTASAVFRNVVAGVSRTESCVGARAPQ
jgi:hypothetical protein